MKPVSKHLLTCPLLATEPCLYAGCWSCPVTSFSVGSVSDLQPWLLIKLCFLCSCVWLHGRFSTDVLPFTTYEQLTLASLCSFPHTSKFQLSVQTMMVVWLKICSASVLCRNGYYEISFQFSSFFPSLGELGIKTYKPNGIYRNVTYFLCFGYISIRLEYPWKLWQDFVKLSKSLGLIGNYWLDLLL